MRYTVVVKNLPGRTNAVNGQHENIMPLITLSGSQDIMTF